MMFNTWAKNPSTIMNREFVTLPCVSLYSHMLHIHCIYSECPYAPMCAYICIYMYKYMYASQTTSTLFVCQCVVPYGIEHCAKR